MYTKMCIKGTCTVDRGVSRHFTMGFPLVRNYRNILQLADHDDYINITNSLAQKLERVHSYCVNGYRLLTLSYVSSYMHNK